MIVEGCDILLDVNQVFVRQGESVGNRSFLSYPVRVRVSKRDVCSKLKNIQIVQTEREESSSVPDLKLFY